MSFEERQVVRVVGASIFRGETGPVRKVYPGGEVDVYLASVGEEVFFGDEGVELLFDVRQWVRFLPTWGKGETGIVTHFRGDAGYDNQGTEQVWVTFERASSEREGVWAYPDEIEAI